MKSVRRYKVKCLSCGAVFNHDYKRSHESNKHSGQNVRVKTLGAPENPFALASKKVKHASSLSKSESQTDQLSTSTRISVEPGPTSVPMETEPEANPCTSSLREQSLKFNVLQKPIAGELNHFSKHEGIEDDKIMNETSDNPVRNAEFENVFDNDDGEIGSPVLSLEANEPMINTKQALGSNFVDSDSVSFEQCVGSFASLTDQIALCRNILDDVNRNSALDGHSTVLKIMESIESIKSSCEDTLNICSIFDRNIEEKNKKISIDEDANQLCQLVNHDPGLRGELQTDNEKRYLISLGPHQPILGRFPTDGKNRFNPKWYREYSFLEYSTAKDAAFCFACFIFPRGAGREKAENAWSHEGVTAWGKMKSGGKKEKGKLDKHFSSSAHKCAMSDYAHFLKKDGHIDHLLDSDIRKTMIEEERITNFNKKTVEILIDIAKTLGRQGLAFRGAEDDIGGNFRQITSLVARHNPILKYWMENKKFRPYHVSYFGKGSQNEFIKLIGNEIRREMAKELSECKFVTVMADTTPDSSNKDILSVVVRSVGAEGILRERLIDVVVVTDKTGLGLAKSIIQSLNDIKVDTKKLAFQSYDFAASMSGQFKGAQQHISELVGHKVPYVACQAHRTNTAVEHSCNVSKIVGDLFNTLEELYVFFSSSTKRSRLFEEKIIQIENSLHLKNLSKTRWTARAESIDAVNKSLEAIIDLLLEISNSKGMDTKTKSKAYGLYKKVLTFDFVIALMFMKTILYKTKVLTKLLESTNLNIIDIISCIKSTIASIDIIRKSETEVDNLIESAKMFASKLNVDCENDFSKHHKRRVAPKRLDENRDTQVVHSLNSFYKQEFLLVMDTLSGLLSSNVTNCVNSLQPCFQLFAIPLRRENLKPENITSFLEMFPDKRDLPSMDALQAELEILFDICKSAPNMDEVVNQAQKMGFLKLAFEAVQFVITAGYSVATNERKFSILKLIKSDIRSRMGDERLRDLLTMKSEIDITDNINLEEAVKLWSELKKRRIRIND